MPKLSDLLNNTNTSIAIIRDLIIKEAKKNLAQGGKYGSYNASGALSDSIQAEDVKDQNGKVTTGIKMLKYGEYIDKGVKGTKKGKSYAEPKPYAYTSKMPPPSKLDKWIVRRNIAPRDKEGKFIPRKSIQFLIARSIFEKGIKPTLFLTKPFEKYTINMKQEITDAFEKDVQEYIKLILK